MYDVAFGSRKPEKLEDVQNFHSPRIPWNIHDPKVGRLENPHPFWILGGQCLLFAYIPVKCTPGDELDTYQWLCHWWWHFMLPKPAFCLPDYLQNRWTSDCCWKGSRPKMVLPALGCGFFFPLKGRRQAVWCLEVCSTHTRMLRSKSWSREHHSPSLVKGGFSRPLTSEDRHWREPLAGSRSMMKGRIFFCCCCYH